MTGMPNKRGAGKGGSAHCGVLDALGPPCLTANVRSTMGNRAQDSADALLKVFAMFKFTPKQVIKIGSLAHLVEMFGASKEDVPEGLHCLVENGLLVKKGEFDLYLTELGYQKMHETSS